MKKIAFSICSFFLSVTMNAQNNIETPNRPGDYRYLLNSLNESNILPRANKKSRSIEQRVIHDSLFDGIGAQFTPVETSDYNYSGGRGSKFMQSSQPNIFSQHFDSDVYTRTAISTGLQTIMLKQFDVNDNLTFFITLGNDPNMPPMDTIELYKNFQYQNNLITYRERWTSANDKKDKEEYSYDANNNLVTYVFSMWDVQNNVWLNNRRESYLYNGLNKCTEILAEKWNLMTNAWVYDWRMLNTYNANNYVISTTRENHVGMGSWSKTLERLIFYDANNRTQYIHVFSRQPNAEYDGYFKYSYQGNSTLHEFETYYRYDHITQDTLEFFKSDYTFDADDNVLTRNNIKWNVNAWSDSSYLNKYYYEDYTSWPASVTSEFAIQNPELFPNPATGSSYLRFSTSTAIESNIEIIDLVGNILYHTRQHGYKGDHLVLLPSNNLSKGIYIIRIRMHDHDAKSLKLIKE